MHYYVLDVSSLREGVLVPQEVRAGNAAGKAVTTSDTISVFVHGKGSDKRRRKTF